MDQRALEELIAHEVADKAIPSISYAVADRDGLMASGHLVRAGLGHRLDDRSLFRIGSLTKMFTAIGIMQLAERGLVDLDADVSAYIPGFRPENPFAGQDSGPYGSQVSLRKLMSHTAGVVREAKDGHYLDDRPPTLEATVEGLKTSVLKDDPSAGVMHYSNAGIALVGRVLELVSGLSYADYLSRHIFGPLGMTDSFVGLSPAVRDRLAPAWMWDVGGDVPAPVFDLGGAPAGAIFSTVPDMAKFATWLLRGGFTPDGRPVLSPASLQQMWVPVGRMPAGSIRRKGYGLGFGTGQVDGWPSVGHGGAVYGYSTQLEVLPQAGLAALTFSTLDFTNQIAGRLVKRALQSALASRRMGPPLAPLVTHPALTAAHLDGLPGLYQAADGSESVEVRAKDGRLYLMGEGVPLELKWRGGDAFTIDGRIWGEEADYPHLDPTFRAADGVMGWKGKDWSRRQAAAAEVPADLAVHLGVYGPDFNPTRLFYADGQLKCLIEYFCTHDCERLPEGGWRMHGILYEGEALELGARDEAGRTGIRVGPMFLVRQTEAA